MTDQYDREFILDKARDLIAAEWESLYGIDVVDSAAPLDLTVHYRGLNAGVHDPQVALQVIDETPGESRIGGDGSGPVFPSDGIVQASCIAGSDELLDRGGVEKSSHAAAYNMAQQVKKIWHSRSTIGLTGPNGGVEYDDIRPGQLRQLPDASREDNPATVGFLVELQYGYEDETPQ